ncbi:hypothetical protein [Mycoplasmopsis cricetuli]|uniref:hypothetical protein n=1 Tax=Mycoplasmopsis cricetuli TaxID=171283 RepID=UPI00046E81E0|nr:hypothetical protein [Mycoplasmopsis cricetuli]
MLSANQEKILKNISLKNQIAHLYLIEHPHNYNIDVDLKQIFAIFNNLNIQTFNQLTDFPNVFYLDSKEQLIKKSNLEEIFSKVELINTDRQRFFVFIKNIDYSSLEGLNSILKSIEEPKMNTTIILTTQNLFKVIDTIKSRSVILKLKNPTFEQLKINFQKNNLFDQYTEVLSRIYHNYDTVIKIYNNENIKIFLDFLGALNDSLKQKVIIYAFLIKNLEKNNQEKTEFILKGFVWILLLNYQLIKFEFNFGNKILNLSKKINKKQPKLINIISFIDQFLRVFKSNWNFSLQKEKLLIELMRLYE